MQGETVGAGADAVAGVVAAAAAGRDIHRFVVGLVAIGQPVEAGLPVFEGCVAGGHVAAGKNHMVSGHSGFGQCH